jgi:DNA-binding beta-propeller fold protein YncE
MAFTPDGATMYAASFGSNLLQTFSRAANGALVAGATTPVGVGPTALATDFGGSVLYVVNASTASVTSFTVAAGGALTPTGPAVPTGGTSPSGRSIAVVDTDDDATLELKAKAKQKVKSKVVVTVKVSADEPIEAKLTGTLSARGLKKVKLKPRTTDIDPAKATKVKLKPKGKSAGRKLAKRLAKGGKAKAKIKASGTDALGNVAKASAKAKLTAKKRE